MAGAYENSHEHDAVLRRSRHLEAIDKQNKVGAYALAVRDASDLLEITGIKEHLNMTDEMIAELDRRTHEHRH